MLAAQKTWWQLLVTWQLIKRLIEGVLLVIKAWFNMPHRMCWLGYLQLCMVAATQSLRSELNQPGASRLALLQV